MALVGDSNGLQPCRGFFKDQKNETIRKRLYASYNTGPFTVYIQIQRLTFCYEQSCQVKGCLLSLFLHIEVIKQNQLL